jgi:hypothetical protein
MNPAMDPANAPGTVEEVKTIGLPPTIDGRYVIGTVGGKGVKLKI